MPDIVKTTNDPADWEKLAGFAEEQAAEANEALELLDSLLATATTREARIAAFKRAYHHVAAWREWLAVEGKWTRPDTEPEDFRTPIEGYMVYRLKPTLEREPSSPAYRLATELTQVALDRMDSAAELQNVVDLRDGRTLNGNLLAWDPVRLGVQTKTGTAEDRKVLRQASFEVLADLETLRADGTLNPHDARQRFIDAAYFLIQGPEVERGTDSVMRTFLCAAYTRIFGVAPILPQAVDLDGMVRGQDGFNRVMHKDLKVVTPPNAPVRIRPPQTPGRATVRRSTRADRSGRITR